MTKIIAFPGAFHNSKAYDEHYAEFFKKKNIELEWVDYFENNYLDDSLEYYKGMWSHWSSEYYDGDIVMGHSMGAIIAEHAFLDNPNIKWLVMLAPSPYKSDLPLTKRILLDVGLWLFKNKPLQFRALAEKDFFSPNLEPDLRKEYIKRYLCSASMKAIKELFAREKFVIDCHKPVLVVSGRDDTSINISAHEKMAKLYKDAEHVVVSWSHDLMLDPKREESAEAISSWIHKNSL